MEHEPRKQRGAEIARAGQIKRCGRLVWRVKSQTGAGTWVVDYSTGEPTCTCPDYEKRAAFCKHIFAIEIRRRRLELPGGPVVIDEPTKYTQDWPAYNKAQTTEHTHFVALLHLLCDGVASPGQKTGRPRTPLCDTVFASVYKVYTRFSGRRATSALNACHAQGLLLAKPNYNTMSRHMNDPALTALLRTLLHESAAPLRGIERKFAADSTGFSTKTYERYFDYKWGSKRKRAKFVKAHAMCGTFTHVVSDLIVSDAGDATQFKPLLDATAARFDVAEVSADKAYLSKKNLQAADDVGAVAYIPFKTGTGTTGGGNDLWSKMYHYFQFKRDEFLAHYHERSNVEAVFGMVKVKFGASVMSKNEIAQRNELYCKFLCHNICVLISAVYELGIAPEFWRTEEERESG